MRLLALSLLLFSSANLLGQVTPAHPSEFGRRGVGSGLNPAMAGVRATGKKKTITINYLAVSKEREWKNKSGVVIKATLLAFESGKGVKPGQPLTLISDGKVRLLVQGRKKPGLVSLDGLSEQDQKFIQTVDRANRESAKEKQKAKVAPGKDGPSLPPPLKQ